MSALRVRVAGIGIAGPGLPNWPVAAEILRGVRTYQSEPWPRYKPERLPANERRRATSLVRLAFQACEEAIADEAMEASTLASVFASSGGDMDISTRICEMLAQDQTALSPTQFHNSVHNAAAGYWSIATSARGPSCSLSGHDGTAAAGLLEAASLVAHEQQPTLLAVYDIPTPAPLHAKRPIDEPLAWALVLLPADQGCGPVLQMDCLPAAAFASSPAVPEHLHALYSGHPAGRGLPLLQLLASPERTGSASLEGNAYSLQLSLQP